MIEPEVINIESKMDEKPIKLSNDTSDIKNEENNIHISTPKSTGGDTNKSSNSGIFGLDMLMNGKKKDKTNTSPKSDINIDDLNKLENDLKDLSEPEENKKKLSFNDNNFKLDNENTNNNTLENKTNNNLEPIKLNFSNTTTNVSEDHKKSSNLNNDSINDIGKNTINTASENTWDGYKKFNDIPINPENEVKEKPKSKNEILREKFQYLRKLQSLEKKGVKLSKRYSMDSSLDEMKGEYEDLVAEREKGNSIKFQGKIMTAIITGLEYLNNKFDPFDLKLDGWSESVTENLDDYDDIFSELHEKYQSKAKMAPELKLLFQLGGSAVMLHMTNTMFKSAMPGMDDIMKQNPELMQQFTQAATNTMGQQNPGFGNFMSGLMGGQGGGTSSPSPRQQEPLNRPDIGMSRQQQNNGRFQDSENIDHSYGHYNQERYEPPQKTKRPEMKGPSNINDLLGGLKTKKINMQEKNNNKQQNTTNNNPQTASNSETKKESGSTISIDELKLIAKDADNIPTKTKRRPRSERNTVSLDI